MLHSCKSVFPHVQMPLHVSVNHTQVIQDYTTPPNEELSRDLVNKLKPYIRYEAAFTVNNIFFSVLPERLG